jgi:hypothetical protein
MCDNLKIEGGFNFYAALDDDSDNEADNEVCLLSGQMLDYTRVKLPCGHCYNYYPLYKEVLQQKRTFVPTEIIRLGYNEIKCPYCRTIFPKVLPFIEMTHINNIRGVTSKTDSAFNLFPCSQIIRSGSKKGLMCGKRCLVINNDDYKCTRHMKSKKGKTCNCQQTCQAILKTGKRKGELCGVNIKNTENTEIFCKRHQKK